MEETKLNTIALENLKKQLNYILLTTVHTIISV